MTYSEVRIVLDFPLDRDTETLTEEILDDLGDIVAASARTYFEDRTEVSMLLIHGGTAGETWVKVDRVLGRRVKQGTYAWATVRKEEA